MFDRSAGHFAKRGRRRLRTPGARTPDAAPSSAKARLTLRFPDGTETVHRASPGPRSARVKSWRAARRIIAQSRPRLRRSLHGRRARPGRTAPSTSARHPDRRAVRKGAAQPVMRPARSRSAAWSSASAQFNPATRARRNVAHHYDLERRALRACSSTSDRQYSCAYFRTRRRDAGRGAGGQEAAHRGQAAADPAGPARCSTSAAAGAAWR